MKTTIIFLSFLFHLQIAWSAEAPLVFELSGQPVVETNLPELIKKLKTHEIQFYNPLYHKEKSYLAFEIKDLLDLAYQSQWHSTDFSDIAFTALDGYQSVSPLRVFNEGGAFLAYQEIGSDDDWELVGRKQANPGPYFLVWTGDQQTTENAYPWPWQVQRVNLLRFSDIYPAVVPQKVPKNENPDSSVYAGFMLFKNRCLRCHAIDQQGGKIGPDLNAPQNITSYRSKEMIIEIIKHASVYRYTQMPDHTDLTDQDLENLYLYLKHQSR